MDKRVTSGKDTRRRHSEELKQALVERSLEPGASVAAIAQRPSSGVIEIDVGATRVRLRGTVDEASVRCVLRLLGAIA